jgi:hypothetical protein
MTRANTSKSYEDIKSLVREHIRHRAKYRYQVMSCSFEFNGLESVKINGMFMNRDNDIFWSDNIYAHEVFNAKFCHKERTVRDNVTNEITKSSIPGITFNELYNAVEQEISVGASDDKINIVEDTVEPERSHVASHDKVVRFK